ncbi:MAG: FAD-binding oxidoreductase [Pseudanabaenaceae cyanobacterium bins.68]|nr:FAD-binding oxidoreductase [Pseudanabaenaceae cyanobacterium bins.68]
MTAYDWLVVGAGITGAALAYELQKAGFKVGLIEPNPDLQGGSRWGYGGIPYWAGSDLVTQTISAQGWQKYQGLSEDLGIDIGLRELPLLLTIAPEQDSGTMPGNLLSPDQAAQLEPLLNPRAIAGAWLLNHAHVSPVQLCEAYIQAFQTRGGKLIFAKAQQISTHKILTDQTSLAADQIAICSGGWSRELLARSRFQVKLYFTHCEVFESDPTDLELRCMVMPLTSNRLDLERQISQAAYETNWQQQRLIPTFDQISIDVGAVQFSDRSLKIGQSSYIHPDPNFTPDLDSHQIALFEQVKWVLPGLTTLKGTYHHCLVGFSPDALPLIGALPQEPNIHLFTSFTTPMIYAPPLAERFAQRFAASFRQADPILDRLSPQRFDQT